MPRSIGAAFLDMLRSKSAPKTFAEWIQIAPGRPPPYPVSATGGVVPRSPGPIIGMVNHDKDLFFDGGNGNGVVRHRARLGFIRSTFRESLSQHLSTMNIQGYLDPAGVTRADIVAGKYKGVEFWFGLVNWGGLTAEDFGQNPVAKLMRGQVGRITVRDHSFDMELRSVLDRFNRQVGETVTPTNVGQFLPGMRGVMNP